MALEPYFESYTPYFPYTPLMSGPAGAAAGAASNAAAFSQTPAESVTDVEATAATGNRYMHSESASGLDPMQRQRPSIASLVKKVTDMSKKGVLNSKAVGLRRDSVTSSGSLMTSMSAKMQRTSTKKVRQTNKIMHRTASSKVVVEGVTLG